LTTSQPQTTLATQHPDHVHSHATSKGMACPIANWES
jgi:hypothetical protein